jgi:hypothetical protein
MYERDMPKFRAKPHQKVLLTFDPGSVNMGIAATMLDLEKRKARVLANAVMENPIKGLVHDIQGTRQRFVKEVDAWVERFKPHGMVMERFQSRGLRGNTAEEVSIMIGIMLERYGSRLPFKIITAATWKNDFHRKWNDGKTSGEVDLKELYKEVCVPPHQLDATLIGLYGLKIGTRVDFDYDLDRLLGAVEHASLCRLINRVRRRK